MKRVKIFNFTITLALIFLASVPKMESRIPVFPFPSSPPHPLCASQLALVNYACARLPFTPGSPPSSQLTSTNDDGEGHGSRHGHGHRRHHHHHSSPQEENCCRWAGELDSQCVCEILVRLPPFLTRPAHQYSVTIGESCNITYSCGGPI
ncbi:uncharacterized protein LOC130720694 [Lotus japonicus]|uniref:uncharacterized protein LOC130720694 n=1 Tax=Lotus japonicus TaxID=34305 RepID=UPI002587BDAB|nr:uncharacterized protein LOC130720694 [Lotus japonicus]